MSYPRRGNWMFRNVKRDFVFYPTLASIQISQEAPDVVATLSCTVVDDGEGWEFVEEDEVRFLFDSDRVFAGHLKVVTKSSVSEVGPRQWHLEAQDYTAKLGDAIIRQRKHRPAEGIARRINWIVSYLRNAWHIDGRDFKLPSEQVERTDYFGMTVAEALDNVANEEGLRYWIDGDNVLNIRKDEQSAAPFALDNIAPDLVTSFPFREFSYRRDSTELANAILVEPEKREDSRWSAAAGNIATYEWGDSTGRQELFIAAEEIRSARGAKRHGMTQLQRTKVPDGEGHLVCYEPGIWAGMTVTLREALWEMDTTLRVIRVDISAVDPDDESGKAYMRCELTLSNKPKRRSPKMGRPEADDTADTTPETFDDYDRDVTPPALSDGSALSIGIAGHIMESRVHVIAPWVLYPDQDDTLYNHVGPTWVAGRHDSIQSGWNNSQPHTARPHTWASCGGLDYCMVGSNESEQWFALTVPAHPANQGGIRFSVTQVGRKGAGYVGPMEVVVSDTQPTALREGSAVAMLTADQYAVAQTVYVPGSLIPAAGGVLYIGYRPGWTSNAKLNAYGYWCGWPSHTGPTAYNFDSEGTAYGGMSGESWWSAPSSAVWQVWDGTAPDLGTTPETTDAPFEGGHTATDAGTEGDGDAWSLDGSGFVITAEAPSGKGITYIGSNEDPDEPNSPWADVAWGVEHTFSISAVGDTGAAGLRHIETTTTGQGKSCVGTVHLGDGERAAGISVEGPLTTDYLAKTITVNEVWRAKFDTRNGLYVRGKLWRAKDGEPATWDVMALLDATEDDADRYTLWLRAGNGVGFPQTVRVDKTTVHAAAGAGTKIAAELLGKADGTTRTFYTSHAYAKGSLRVLVNGIKAVPPSQVGAEARFTLDFCPTAGSILRATYTPR